MPNPFKNFVILAALILLIPACRSKLNYPYSVKKKVVANRAMVVSAHPVATEAGLDVLRKGGNAVDAAVAVHFALAVVYPGAGNIGGGGFMIHRDQGGRVHALDFREKAPGTAHRDMYLDSNGQVIEGLSLNGALAAGVPGSVAGLWTAHQKFGKLPWSELLKPAFKLAAKGVALTKREADKLNDYAQRFQRYNRHTTAFQKSQPWQEGELLIQPDLAETLKAIRDQGRDGFYRGKVADLIVAEMKALDGIISHEDLINYEAVWRDPIQFNYRGHQIHSMPPPSSGGVAIAQLFQMTEPYSLAEMGFHSAAATHLMTEVERRVYADRAKHLGDTDFYDVPVSRLVDADYLKMRMQDYSETRATSSDSIRAGVPEIVESEETTHYSIVDAQGNAVSITTTLNSGFGSKTVVQGAGFLLNNEMDDFSIKMGVPNLYGLLGAEANAIEPGKRMLSSMTPTIVSKDNTLYMVVGTPGGATIITSVFQVISNVIDHRMGMAEAIAAPRFHHQWKPDQLQHEKEAFSDEVKEKLRRLGHQLKERSAIGRVEGILVMPDGRLEGGADPRGDDHAAGF